MSTPTITSRPGEGASGPVPSGPSIPLPPTPADSGPALCGLPHEYKTKTGEQRSKPCVKARGHSGPHSSRAQGPRIDVSVVKLDMLQAEDVPGDETLDILTERVRSAEQLVVDGHVAEGHKKWIAAGKPAGANDAIRKNAATRYRVAPENVAAVRTMLRRSESANPGIHVRILPPKKHVDGTMMIYFIAVDKSAARATAGAAANPTSPASGQTVESGGPAASASAVPASTSRPTAPAAGSGGGKR